MSPSSMRKTNAYTAGVLHADGDKDTRSSYKGEMLEAYDLGFNERTAEIERAREEAERDEPINAICRDADAIAARSGDTEVRELATLVERLACIVKELNSDR